MARRSLRSRRETLARVSAVRARVAAALPQFPGASEPELVDGVWQAEGLGVLLWALNLAVLPPFDRTFDPERLLATGVKEAHLRDRAEIEHQREAARLWHWRARTAALRSSGEPALPPGWSSFEALIAVAALRGHERGFLPAPVRGDFPAFGTGYRALSDEQRAELLSIAFERHRALNWLCGLHADWDETPTDT